MRNTWIVAAMVLVCVSGVQAQVVIETVTVGNPGNAGELSGAGAGGYGPDCICGAVDYVLNIDKFEVTAGQYAEFLNAVAATDTYGLYNTQMWAYSYGCKIERTGASPNYQYSVGTDWADRPVDYVSWGDAARFANWLHNGQPAGQLTGDPTQDAGLTEDGSYSLNGATSNAELLAIVREPDATWVIPSEDEWYKAAYYDGGSSVYYDYPTSSDSVPSNDLVDPDPGNNATILDGGYTIGSPYYRTEVGAHENSDSPYATYDQGGNVWEWNEAILYGSSRGLRGGPFGTDHHSLLAAYRGYSVPAYENHDFGFRVADVSSECGNGVPEYGEECDDSGTSDGDGCSSICTIEEGWQCSGMPSICVPEGVPTVSEWGLMAMALLVLTAGTLACARRRRVVA